MHGTAPQNSGSMIPTPDELCSRCSADADGGYTPSVVGPKRSGKGTIAAHTRVENRTSILMQLQRLAPIINQGPPRTDLCAFAVVADFGDPLTCDIDLPLQHSCCNGKEITMVKLRAESASTRCSLPSSDTAGASEHYSRRSERSASKGSVRRPSPRARPLRSCRKPSNADLRRSLIKAERDKSPLVLSTTASNEVLGISIRGIMIAHRNPTHHTIYTISQLDAARIYS
jgi:hypothetical protein